jgi:arsenate reductase
MGHSCEDATMPVTIYHNPGCSNSRGALAILRARGIEPVVVEYLKTPPDRATLKALVAKMGVPVAEVVRFKEAAAAGLSPQSSDDALLDALAANPVLLNRPIVVTDKGARLCRPPETVSELL